MLQKIDLISKIFRSLSTLTEVFEKLLSEQYQKYLYFRPSNLKIFPKLVIPEKTRETLSLFSIKLQP